MLATPTIAAEMVLEVRLSDLVLPCALEQKRVWADRDAQRHDMRKSRKA